MSHGKIRHDKTCLNCGHFVKEHFCPNCGQENIETRQPFHYLFTHFIEDFTHYDGQFWTTIKNLLFKPGKLTATYLQGKRQLFVPPVKLYIFISFITFLLIAFSNLKVESKDLEDRYKTQKEAAWKNLDPAKVIEEAKKDGNLSKEDSLAIIKTFPNPETDKQSKNKLPNFLNLKKPFSKNSDYNGAKNMKEFDSVFKNTSSFKREINRPIAKKYYEFRDHGTPKEEIINSFIMVFFHSIPKALFLYMPLFALFLWIFHNKKKWWYFDHGIFTLHYFSFLLLMVFIVLIINKIAAYFPESGGITTIKSLLYSVMLIYSIVYFYTAHHRVYKTSRIVSFIIGSIIFFLNYIAFLMVLLTLVYISIVMMH